ncbi:unnamed protein product [Bursaphelenchus xylophilus]|uniref:(pine wood nematode) hypothetical protein n=1 Tax=Bursaphelenchus xylophilus TaxID=6326 RepID=A0A7I8WM56_BURXY|nr:unnamed protein product [Bursaphelenchus xylophilus]CAG9104903.1 unnamed protein product [Bursaphelenchus xylophilus]
MKRRLVVVLAFFLFGLALLFFRLENGCSSTVPHSRRTSNWPKLQSNISKRAANVTLATRRVKVFKNWTGRKRMEQCPPIYGKIGIFISHWKGNDTLSPIPLDSIRCYVKSTNYTLFEIDMNTDRETRRHCSQYKDIMFRRHCAVTLYAKKVDWLVVLDADTAVVNPSHCIEEYIDPSVDIIFYERFHNFEIAAGNFLVRHSKFSQKFLLDWAGYFNERQTKEGEWFSNRDNGALLIHLARNLRPEAEPEIDYCNEVWHNIEGLGEYFAYVTCVRWILGAQRKFPGKIRIHRRADGIARDLWVNDPVFCEHDFMLHGFKDEKRGNPIFSEEFDVSKCGRNFNGWNWNRTFVVSCERVKEELIRSEDFFRWVWFPNASRVDHFMNYQEMSRCWPNCDKRRGKRI